MQSPEGEFYLEKVPLYLDRVKDGCATLDLDEKLFNLHFDLSDGYRKLPDSPCQRPRSSPPARTKKWLTASSPATRSCS